MRRLLFRKTTRWDRDLPETCTEDDIYYCFRLLLGRPPSAGEWTGHCARVGRDLPGVVSEYLSSREFKSRDLLGVVATDQERVDLGDFAMCVSPSDHAVGRPILKHKTYESHVTAAMRNCLRAGMTFLDVGANIGYFTLLGAHLVGSAGRVIAVEPFQHNLKLLIQSVAMNGFGQVEIFPLAALDRSELLTLDSVGSNGQVGALPNDPRALIATTIVFGMRLDDLLREVDRVDVVKLDIEGAEYRAVSGARQLLERSRPIIFSEFSPPGLAAVSRVDARTYLDALLIDDRYHFEVINLDGTLTPCGRDHFALLRSFEASGVDHIDIIARPS